MNRMLLAMAAFALTCRAASAQPTKVAVLDFQDQTGMKPDALLGGAIAPGALADKGPMALAKQLLGNAEYTLIDRREFVKQVEKLQPEDGGRKTPTKPSFLQAAQALGADAVLRGSLVSFSTGGEKIDQGGYKVDFTKLSVRVVIEALDAVDGSVIAIGEGAESMEFRQTQEQKTILSEDDAIALLGKAIAKAVPDLDAALKKKVEAARSRPKVKITVASTDDPAMVEIDGILVGSTPLEALEVYKGDHVLTVTRPGYQTITKRLLLAGDTKISVPMLRTDLTAEEKKAVMEKAEMKMYFMDGKPDLVIQKIE